MFFKFQAKIRHIEEEKVWRAYSQTRQYSEYFIQLMFLVE